TCCPLGPTLFPYTTLFRSRSDDPAYLNVDPAWYDTHVQTRTVPLLGAVTCNAQLFPALIGALTDVEAAGLGRAIHIYSGCYAARSEEHTSELQSRFDFVCR